MKRRLSVLLIALVAIVTLSGCDKPGTYYSFGDNNIQHVQLHAEWETEVDHAPWDLSPPERLDIIMWPDHMEIYDEPAYVRCEKMGGDELIYYPKTDQHICEDIDY